LVDGARRKLQKAAAAVMSKLITLFAHRRGKICLQEVKLSVLAEWVGWQNAL